MDEKDKDKDKKSGLPLPPSGTGKPGVPPLTGAASSKPSIPTLKDTLKPQVKIKGLSTGLSLVERLKAFKKKDLAFITAGLGVLLMAPLAEHFLMAPDSSSGGAFKEGWGFRGDGAGAFGKGGSPYEGGINGLAPGGLAGGGSDVITPLNVRDPSQLVMGPGASSQPPAGSAPSASAAPPSAPSAPSAPAKSDDWKDALAAGGARAGRAAVKSGGLPVPKVPLSNGGLRGLGAVGGAGGGSFSLPALSAGNVPNRAAQSNSPNAKAAPGFRGAARGSGSGANVGALENLKKAAGQAGSDLNRGGSAVGNLETAASRDMSGGASSGGASEGNAGAGDKATTGSQSKDSKSPGESLEFLRQKMEMEKAEELKWKLIEQQTMLWPNIQQKMLETVMIKGIAEPIAGIGPALFGGVGKAISGTTNRWTCDTNPPTQPRIVSAACSAPGASGAPPAERECVDGGNNLRIDGTVSPGWTCRAAAGNTGSPTDCPNGQTRAPAGAPNAGQCVARTGDAPAAAPCPTGQTRAPAGGPNAGQCVASPGGPAAPRPTGPVAPASNVSATCQGLADSAAAFSRPIPAPGAAVPAGAAVTAGGPDVQKLREAADLMRQAAQHIAWARDLALKDEPALSSCQIATMRSGTPPAAVAERDASIAAGLVIVRDKIKSPASATGGTTGSIITNDSKANATIEAALQSIAYAGGATSVVPIMTTYGTEGGFDGYINDYRANQIKMIEGAGNPKERLEALKTNPGADVTQALDQAATTRTEAKATLESGTNLTPAIGLAEQVRLGKADVQRAQGEAGQASGLLDQADAKLGQIAANPAIDGAKANAVGVLRQLRTEVSNLNGTTAVLTKYSNRMDKYKEAVDIATPALADTGVMAVLNNETNTSIRGDAASNGDTLKAWATNSAATVSRDNLPNVNTGPAAGVEVKLRAQIDATLTSTVCTQMNTATAGSCAPGTPPNTGCTPGATCQEQLNAARTTAMTTFNQIKTNYVDKAGEGNAPSKAAYKLHEWVKSNPLVNATRTWEALRDKMAEADAIR